MTPETAAGSRSLSVLLPSVRVWENSEPKNASGATVTLVPGTPYVVEEYIPGPVRRISLGPLGELEALPVYIPRVYVPANVGRGAASKYADALVTLFAPSTSLTMTGATLQVRGDPGPFPGQLLQLETGFAGIAVTVPLRYRTPSSI